MGVGLPLMREVGTGMCRRLVFVDFLFLLIALLLQTISQGRVQRSHEALDYR